MIRKGEACYPKAVPGAFGDVVVEKIGKDVQAALLKAVLEHTGINLRFPSYEVQPGDIVVVPGGDVADCEEESSEGQFESALKGVADTSNDKTALEWLALAKVRYDAIGEMLTEIDVPVAYKGEGDEEEKALVKYISDCVDVDRQVRDLCEVPEQKANDGFSLWVDRLLDMLGLGLGSDDFKALNKLMQIPTDRVLVDRAAAVKIQAIAGNGFIADFGEETAEKVESLVASLDAAREIEQEITHLLQILLEGEPSVTPLRCHQAVKVAADLMRSSPSVTRYNTLLAAAGPLLERLTGSAEVTPEAFARALELLGPASEF